MLMIDTSNFPIRRRSQNPTYRTSDPDRDRLINFLVGLAPKGPSG